MKWPFFWQPAGPAVSCSRAFSRMPLRY
jgi:hypothetical protein